jgi:hypothetical protein
MSISDEKDLMGRLDRAFQTITPGQAPVERAVRHGRVIRIRRRLTAAAGLAIVAAGIAVPVLLQQQAAPPAFSRPGHRSVTVRPPGPHAPAGLIASGTVDGKHWAVTAEKPGTGGAARDAQCFMALSMRDCGPVTAPSNSAPVAFLGSSSGPTDSAYGPVSAAVSYVTVRLADGTVLTLHPVSMYGTRYVAFAVPLHMVINKITAYAAHGEMASAIPFNSPDGSADVGLWLRPGQTGLRRAAHLIGSGGADGRAWSVTAYVGPWGECVLTRAGGDISSGCNPVSSPQGTLLLGSSSGSPGMEYGSASADVQHVVITVTGGRTIRVRTITAGEQKFFAFPLSQGQHAVRWQAYDGARHEVGSGRLNGPQAGG